MRRPSDFVRNEQNCIEVGRKKKSVSSDNKTKPIMLCHMYILLCGDGSYYTGSTRNLEKRMNQHKSGEGAIHTKMHQPVELIYFEEFNRIDHAFYREKQIQRWSHEKKKALIEGRLELLKQSAKKKFNR
jgi:putative endonuclease